MNITHQLDAIIAHLQHLREDAVKVDAGKLTTPATRVRTGAQAAKKALDALRKSVQDARANG
jgi:translation initiation factor 2 alpha subunit (eIF-2alpha)